MNILEKLERELDRGLDELAKLDPQSEEYKTLNDHLGDLFIRHAELKKQNDEDKNKSKDRNAEQWHRIIGYGLTLVSIGVPLYFRWKGLKLAFVFEETGTIASQPARACLNDILANKK